MHRKIIAISFLLFSSWAFQSFAQVPNLPNNTAVDLGPFPCTQLAGDYACNKVTDYSGMVYDSANHRMLMFGGGHASTFTDTIFSLNLNIYPYTWSELYPPTDCSEMTPGNYDKSNGAWISGSKGPYPRPIARHTYDELAVANGEFIILAAMNGGQQLCPKGFDFTTGDPFFSWAKIAHYNFASGQWSFSPTALTDGYPDTGANPAYAGTAYDPVNGQIVLVSKYGLWTYNASTKTKARRIRGDYGEWKNNQGQTVSASSFGINPSLVYFSATDKYYLFDYSNGFKVWELVLNRSNWLNSTITQLTTTGPIPTCGQRQWAYDSTNQIIGGGVCNSQFFAFNPATRNFVQQSMQGGSPGNLAFHALDYDPINNVFIFVTEGRRTWAYRYANSGTLTSDNVSPSVPTGVSASVISTSQINLSWSPSTDNVGVAGYKIYRNGNQITAVSGTSYQDTGLSAGTTYIYTVAAYDATGNTSSQSSQVSAATQNNVSLSTNCASEGGLVGRTDIIYCEPWENPNWWQNGYEEVGAKSAVIPATGPDQSVVVTTGCISGSCLKVNLRAWYNGGAGGALGHHWPIPGRQQEIYLRYYLKLAPNFSPNIYSVTDGSSQGSGGKFPGLGDTRAYPDIFTDPLSGKTYNQCGNGGATADGINCWSARANFHGCTGSGGANTCQPNATTRYGFYWYLPNNADPTHPLNTNQAPGLWDNQPWATANGPCSNPQGIGNWNNSATGCGIGTVGLLNDVWYLMEWHIKMNTPGVADGVAEGWINGVLKYRKTNVEYRNVGHDDLHVRTVWLNVHGGGEFVGMGQDTAIYLDQMVVATGARPGPWGSSTGGGSTPPPVAPSNLAVR